MELNWLYTFLAIDGALLSAVVTTGFAVCRARRDLKTERERSILETGNLQSAVQALQTELAEVKRSAASADSKNKPFIPTPALTADQRAGALEMLRSGAGAGEVSGALHLTHPQVVLLQKVQRLLDSTSSPN
jgi:phage gp16-like protein